MIKLLHGLTKFRSILIKLFFINNQEPILDSPALTQVPLAKESFVETAPQGKRK